MLSTGIVAVTLNAAGSQLQQEISHENPVARC